MSDDAYCLYLVRRALARSDEELRGYRGVYEVRARQLAERIISSGFAAR
ncbi:hypothetical protein [Burkholderia arboris]|nr:hypothetical protein [Burkholderia arboris]MCA8050903.1 hypothetical protein [Burkholderia arboris]